MEEIEFDLKPEFCPHKWQHRVQPCPLTMQDDECYKCAFCKEEVRDIPGIRAIQQADIL